MDKASIIKALRDTAQSASNSIASNVSGPVDLLAAGLRGVGLPIPQNPMGGSQWMAEKGLTREVEMGAPRIIGETLGMAGPTVIAAKAPQIAAGMNQMGANLAEPATLNRQAGMALIGDSYRGGHTAPMKDRGAPLHDLTQVYPDDIYSSNAARFYGTGDDIADKESFRKVAAYKGNADAPVTMYRAVPNDLPMDAKINHGDWVTLSPSYAKVHGEGPLGGNYRVIQQNVPARKLFTNGDSINEFGYDETGKISPAMLGLLGLGAGGAAYYGNK